MKMVHKVFNWHRVLTKLTSGTSIRQRQICLTEAVMLVTFSSDINCPTYQTAMKQLHS